MSEREKEVKKDKERMKSAKIKRKKQQDMYLEYGEILRLLSERERENNMVSHITPLPMVSHAMSDD